MENASNLSEDTSTMSRLEMEDLLEDLFQQRINHIRMELDHTYNIFINAQETLSSISFENLSERLNSTSFPVPTSGTSSPVNEQISPNSQEFSVVRGVGDRLDIARSIEQLTGIPKEVQRTRAVEEIPELNKFFKVISDLTEGIKKINGHQQSITELNQDISMFSNHATNAPGSCTAQLADITTDQLADMSIE